MTKKKKAAFVWLLCDRAWPCITALLINANDPCPKGGLFSPHKKPYFAESEKKRAEQRTGNGVSSREKSGACPFPRKALENGFLLPAWMEILCLPG